MPRAKQSMDGNENSKNINNNTSSYFNINDKFCRNLSKKQKQNGK